MKIAREMLLRSVSVQPIRNHSGAIEKSLSVVNHALDDSRFLGKSATLYVPPKLTGFPNQVRHYPLARIIGKSPVAVDASGSVIEATIFRTNERTKSALSQLRTLDFLKIFDRRLSSKIFLPGNYVLLDSHWGSFGHWIPEHLLKVHSLIRAGFDIGKLHFVVRLDTAGMKKELLMRAGINPGQIVHWRGDPISVENLIVPDYPEISPEGLGWLNSLFPRNSDLDPQKKILYLSRKNLRERRVTNENQLSSLLGRFGVIEICPEELPIAEQVRLFQNSHLIIGAGGSAFTGQIFMPAKSRVIEAFGMHRVHLFNMQVSLVLGHHHFSLFDRRVSLNKIPTPAPMAQTSVALDLDVEVNVDELAGMLKASCLPDSSGSD